MSHAPSHLTGLPGPSGVAYSPSHPLDECHADVLQQPGTSSAPTGGVVSTTVFYGIPDHDGIPDHFPGYVQEKKSVLLGPQNIF